MVERGIISVGCVTNKGVLYRCLRFFESICQPREFINDWFTMGLEIRLTVTDIFQLLFFAVLHKVKTLRREGGGSLTRGKTLHGGIII